MSDRCDRDEGVIKFTCDWQTCPTIAAHGESSQDGSLNAQILTELNTLKTWRDRLFAWGVIGVYPEGIGFGNVSVRLKGEPWGERGGKPLGKITGDGAGNLMGNWGAVDRFLISGTQTGHLPITTLEHYTVVDQWDIERNWLHCYGPIRASSESLTHAAVYRQDATIAAIIHGHHPHLWRTYQHQLPTTRAEVPYGTPAMAQEMARLFTESDLLHQRVLVMAGHEDGFLSFGQTLAEAAAPIARLLSITY